MAGVCEDEHPCTEEGSSGKGVIDTARYKQSPKPKPSLKQTNGTVPVQKAEVVYMACIAMAITIQCATINLASMIDETLKAGMVHGADILPFDKSDAWPSKWRDTPSFIKTKLKDLFRWHRGLTVDSGAADSVFPTGWLKRSWIRASLGSLRGLFYIAASNTKIANDG